MSKNLKTTHQHKQAKSAPKVQTSSGSSDLKKYFPIFITLIFFILSFLGIMKHEMWRDEYQAWLVARDAHSLPQLLHNLKYEGNPLLWHFFLFIITTFTHNPFWMQVFHILISTAFVYLLNRYSPFPLYQNFLLTFGYYSFFEFNLISRSYGLGFLLVIIFCILYKNRHKYYLWIALVLFLLANTHLFGLLFSIAFSGILFLDYIQNIRTKKIQPVAIHILFLCGIILIGAWIFSAWQIYPSHDNTFPVNYPNAAHHDFLPRIKVAISRIFAIYFPFPNFWKPYFWYGNFFEIQIIEEGKKIFDSGKITFCISFILYFIFILNFLRKPLMLLLYSLTTAILVYFFYYTQLVYIRHTSSIFVILFATMWISAYHQEINLKNKLLSKLSVIGKNWARWVFIIMLVVSMAGGIGAYYTCFMQPFSASKELVEYLKRNNLDKEEIIALPDWGVLGVDAELDRMCYYPFRREHGSFSIFDGKRNESTDPMAVFDQLDSLHKTGLKKMVLIYFFELQSFDAATKSNVTFKEGLIKPDLYLKLLHSIPAGIVPDERYSIYLITEYKKEGEK